MANIPNDFINELLQRVDIVELIDELVPLKRTGSSYVARCPFHEEKTPSFNVSTVKQIYHCFGCGVGGNAISFLMDYERLTFLETIEKLAARTGLSIPVENSTHHSVARQAPQNEDFYTLLTEVSRFYRQQLRDHAGATHAIEYLKNRGISGDIAKKFQIGFAPPGRQTLLRAFNHPTTRENLIRTGMIVKKDNGALQDRYHHRIMFPIHNVRGKIIGFGGRVIEADHVPKYLNSPETTLFQKSRELYGLYQCLQAQRQPEKILIVEGYLDVIALAQFGINYAVATMGTATTKAHLQQLTRHTSKIIFCFDGDKAGYVAAWRALNLCLSHYQDGLFFRFMFLPNGEDPDSLIRREGQTAFEQRIEQATHLADFFINHLQQQIDINSLDGKSALVKLASPLLQTMTDCALKTLLEDKISQLTGLTNEHIHTLSTIASPTRRNLPQKTPHSSPTTTRLTPIQIIISLLLQYPTLFKLFPKELTFPVPAQEEFIILQELVALLQKTPTLATGLLIEHWRDTQHFGQITLWANYKHILHPTSLETEFKGALAHLEKQLLKYRIDQLYLKITKGILSKEEQVELKHLIEEYKANPK